MSDPRFLVPFSPYRLLLPAIALMTVGFLLVVFFTYRGAPTEPAFPKPPPQGDWQKEVCPEGSQWSTLDGACARVLIFQCHQQVVHIKVYAREVDGEPVFLGQIVVPSCNQP